MKVQIISITDFITSSDDKEIQQKAQINVVGYGAFEVKKSDLPESVKVGEVYDLSFSLAKTDDESAGEESGEQSGEPEQQAA